MGGYGFPAPKAGKGLLVLDRLVLGLLPMPTVSECWLLWVAILASSDGLLSISVVVGTRLMDTAW
jgi:hypothetical protein